MALTHLAQQSLHMRRGQPELPPADGCWRQLQFAAAHVKALVAEVVRPVTAVLRNNQVPLVLLHMSLTAEKCTKRVAATLTRGKSARYAFTTILEKPSRVDTKVLHSWLQSCILVTVFVTVFQHCVPALQTGLNIPFVQLSRVTECQREEYVRLDRLLDCHTLLL